MSRRRTLICLFLFSCVAPCVAAAQGNDSSETRVPPLSLPIAPIPSSADISTPTELHPLRLSLVGMGFLGAFVALDQGYRKAWWRGEKVSFHFAEDYLYARNLDKVGHFYGTALTSFVCARSLEWAGFSRPSSVWLGAGLGLMSELYIEIQDGFSPYWGFDRVDAISDLLGATFFLAQYHFPLLQNVDVKFSYFPSPHYGQYGTGNFGSKKQTFIDDFEGHTYWLSMKVNKLLPSKVEPYWPDVLAVAVGVRAANLHADGGGHREVLVGLDYDLTALPGIGGFWLAIKELGNYFRLPAPAVRVYPGPIWYGLYL